MSHAEILTSDRSDTGVRLWDVQAGNMPNLPLMDKQIVFSLSVPLNIRALDARRKTPEKPISFYATANIVPQQATRFGRLSRQNLRLALFRIVWTAGSVFCYKME